MVRTKGNRHSARAAARGVTAGAYSVEPKRCQLQAVKRCKSGLAHSGQRERIVLESLVARGRTVLPRPNVDVIHTGCQPCCAPHERRPTVGPGDVPGTVRHLDIEDELRLRAAG